MDYINVKVYEPNLKTVWDKLLENSRNGTFIHLRDYIEYHNDRYRDVSIVVDIGGEYTAIFPASQEENTIVSHGGLTFGGLIYSMRLRSSDAMRVIEKIIDHYRKSGARKLVYKAIPHIFHSYPAEEDLYALFRVGAMLCRRDISSAVMVDRRPKMSALRRRGVKKAHRASLSVRSGDFFEPFHGLLEKVLERHGASPVHSAAEMALLQQRFPDRISLVGAFLGSELVAGSWLFRYGRVLHTQYLACSGKGREVGALDFLISRILDAPGDGIEIVNFGISTEDDGRRLNEGLIFQKEGFGGRGIVYDHYEILL